MVIQIIFIQEFVPILLIIIYDRVRVTVKKSMLYLRIVVITVIDDYRKYCFCGQNAAKRYVYEILYFSVVQNLTHTVSINTTVRTVVDTYKY